MENKQHNHKYDIVVVGAGLVGLAAVVALSAQGKQVALVDASRKNTKLTKAWDKRVYALTPSTQDWLKQLDVWGATDSDRVEDVKTMLLWHPESKAPLQLASDDANVSKLACIVESQNLMQALWKKIEALNIPVMMESACKQIQYAENTIELHLETGNRISANLLIAADGANSFVRQSLSIPTKFKTFNQLALVANYKTEIHHGHVARQWFLPHETLALLPMPGQHVSMVWALPTDKAKELLMLTKMELAQRVQNASSNELGTLKPVNDTASFPLRQITASNQVIERVAFVGDAAHQVHPMAGQGANLGFRDVIALEKMMANSHPLEDIGDKVFLRKYERVRKADIISINMLTSGLDYWFALESSGFKKLTTVGMQLLNNHANFKRTLIKQAIA